MMILMLIQIIYFRSFDYESYWKDLSMKIDLFDSWCEERLIKNY